MADKDLFGKTTQFGKSNFVTSDYMILKLKNGDSNTEYLIQTVSIQFNRPLQRIYELGSSNTYFGPSRSIGSLQIGRIVGAKSIIDLVGESGTGSWSTDGDPNDHIGSFYKISMNNNSINLKFRMTGLVFESYAASTDANGLLFQEQLSGQFAGLYLN